MRGCPRGLFRPSRQEEKRDHLGPLSDGCMAADLARIELTEPMERYGIEASVIRRGWRRIGQGRSRGRSRGGGRRRGVRRGGGQVSIFYSHSPAIKTSEHFLIRSICDEALSVFGLLVDS